MGLCATLAGVACLGSAVVPASGLAAVTPPVIIKAFGAASVPLAGSTSLTFTIQNNNASTTLHGVGFSDQFPSGLVVAAPNGLSGGCGGGTINAAEGGAAVSLSAGTIAPSSSCSFSIDVTGISAGLKSNTTANVTSTEGGTGGTATASLNVEAPPSLTTALTPTSIIPGAMTSLTFTITNPAGNSQALTGVTFSDILPLGLTVPNASATVCGGTVTLIPPRTIAHTGATISAGSTCIFSVSVTGAGAGHFTNTTSGVASNNGGVGEPSSASIDVGSPPTVSEAFDPASVALGGTARLTLTIANPGNLATIFGIGFTDSLPGGLRLAPDPAPLNSGCGGTLAAGGGAAGFSLSGAGIPALGSCAVSVTVQGTSAGDQENAVSVASNGGPASNLAHAKLTVIGPPEPSTTSPGPGTTHPASNDFKVVGHRVEAGVVTLDVKVPGAGKVTVREGRGKTSRGVFGKASATAGAAATLHLKLRPTTSGKRLLGSGSKFRVKLLLTFSPVGGSPRTVTVSLAL